MRFDDAPISDIVSDYEAGLTIAEVGDKYNIPGRTIHSWLVRLNVPRRRTGVSKGYHFSDERNRNLSSSLKGRAITEKQRTILSESHKCHFNWLNGYGHTKRQSTGYVFAYCPEHPNATRDGYVLLHRVIVEQHIGRYLADDEVVHHINHERADNRIENLMLMKKHEHRSMHMKERHQKRREEKCRKFSLLAI